MKLKKIESRVMPRNSMEVSGPEIFSDARGTPRFENTDLRMVRSVRKNQGGESHPGDAAGFKCI